MPNLKQCSSTTVTMVTEYIEWVDQWDDEVTEFCKWFPFPRVADAQQQQRQQEEEGQKDDQVQEQQLEQKLQPCLNEENEGEKEVDAVAGDKVGEKGR